LKAHGIESGIQKKGAIHIKLSEADHRRNRSKRRIRSHIERIFAHLKKWQDYRVVRYLGLAKNQLELTLKAVAYNLKRIARIIELENA
jgi:ribonuclease P protein component